MRFSFIFALSLSFFIFSTAHSQKDAPDLSFIRKDKIQIARDQWGVPHIYAPTDAEMAYGLAWAQCEDDFATMQEFLLITKGFSGLYSGVDGAKLDYAVAMLKAEELAASEYEKQISPEFRKYLRAFAAGVNRWAELHPKEVKIKKAFPVTEKDIVVAFNLGVSLMSGVQDAFTKILENKLKPLSELNLPKGSNAFAVHPNHTDEGKAFIAINSHQPLEGIMSWYEAHMISDEGTNILGGAFPGACTMGVGANENLAWAHTMSYPDLTDIYKLEIHPRKKNWYRYDGQWKKLESKRIPLRIKFPKSGIRLTVGKKGFWSIYGPTMKTKHGTYSFRLPTYKMLGAPEQWYNMSKAKNYTEFRKTMDTQSIPCFNIVYADRFDTIMYISNVTVPKRNPAYNWRKTLPGDTSATYWEMNDLQPVSALPQVINPPSGYVYNANNSPFQCTGKNDNPIPADYDITMGTQELHTNRSTRIEKRLEEASAKGKISWEAFNDIKFDMQYPTSFSFPVDVSGVFEADPASFPEIREELERLKRWNRKGDTSNIEASLFAASLNFVMDKIGFPEMNSTERPVVPDSILIQAIKEGSAHLKKHFGTLDVPYGKLQRLRRGNVDLPIAGMPDMVVAMYSVFREDGTLAPRAGETYIMMVKMDPETGPEMYTVNAFGAANRPESPHYTDQMEMFTNHKLKRMTLNWKEILQTAVKVYSPQ